MFINYSFSKKHHFNLNLMKTIVPYLLIGLLLSSCREEFLNFNLDSFDEGSRKITEQAKPGTGTTTGEPIIFLTGNGADVSRSTTAGIALIGGAESDTPAEMAAFQFLVSKSGGGDFVVLRSSGSDGYNPYIYTTIGGVNSVRTLLITSRAQADHATTLSLVQNAEAIFIAGGDQSDYLNYWKDTKLETAINEAVNIRKVPIGGTSAGLAILGSHYYGSTAGSVLSKDALANPYHKNMAGLGGNDFLSVNHMQNIITDSHYGERTRQGRHFTFMARLVKDFGLSSIQVKGIGVDEATAVLVESDGSSKVYGAGKAYFLKSNGGQPEVCVSRKALTWNNNGQAVGAYIIPGTSSGSNTFDLTTWTGTGGTSQNWSANTGIFSMN
jgi:cyanophycinase